MSETKDGGDGRVTTPGGGESGSGGGQPGGDAPSGQQAETPGGRGPVRPDALEREGEPTGAPREAELVARVAELEAALERAQRELAHRDRQEALERELTGLGVVDLEIGVALAERILENGDEPDAERAAARLRARKPFLFAERGAESPARRASSAMAVGAVGAVGDGRYADLEELADGARATGDRRELLRYLRARRGV